MVDTPTNNYCTLNPLFQGPNNSLSEGNLRFLRSGGTTWQNSSATMSVSSGKWYWEILINTLGGSGMASGVADANWSQMQSNSTGSGLLGYSSTSYSLGLINSTNYQVCETNSYLSTSPSNITLANGDILQYAIDMSTGKLWIGKNNTWQFSGNPAAGTTPLTTNLLNRTITPVVGGSLGGGTDLSVNFGQKGFTYTPPTGFNSLCTANLPAVAITKPSNYHNEVIWTATNGVGKSVTGVGFQPDLVWQKARSISELHLMYDSVRGATKYLSSNATTAETTTANTLTSFDSDGFTYGTAGASAATYVAWCWKKGATPGFDVVTYTGTGSSQAINHSLGAIPKFMLVKSRSNNTGDGFAVYHVSAGATQYADLSYTGRFGNAPTVWNSTAPTSSVFSIGPSTGTGVNNYTYIAYLWAEVPGFSKFGQYWGNSNTDGVFVYCGFKPRYIMIKKSSAAGNDWAVFDTVRDTINPVNEELGLNYIGGPAGLVQTGANSYIDVLSNGFKLRTVWTPLNNSGDTYIFAAFAELPFGGSNVSPATAR